jgi:mono/diheme cytochrome c family protein
MTIVNKFLLTGYSLAFCFTLVGCGGTSTDDTSTISSSFSASELRDADDKENEHDEKKDSEEDEKDEDEENNNGANITLPVSYTANAGRLLGSQCAQCHGTNGISVTDWDSIAGEGDLESEIFEDDEPIMNAQAHGYTIDEIRSIGDWLRTLKK